MAEIRRIVDSINVVPDSSFEIGAVNNWSVTARGLLAVSGNSASQSAAQAFDGSKSLAVDVPATSGTKGVSYPFGFAPLGTSVAASVYVYVTTTQNVTIGLEDNTSGNGPVTSTTSVTANTWTQLSVAWTPTADSATARLYVYLSAGAAAQTFYIDNVSIVNVLVDLNVANSVVAERDTFVFTPPASTPVSANVPGAYGGSVTVNESHSNGSLAMTLLVSGASASAALSNAHALLGVLETVKTRDLFFEWAPDGAPSSTFFEIRGPATFSTTYSLVEWQSTRAIHIGIEIPVAPLGMSGATVDAGAPTPQTYQSNSWPATATFTSAVYGNAPALGTWRGASGGAIANWGLLAWMPTPVLTPVASTVAPFGYFVATGQTLSGTTTTAKTTDSSNNTNYQRVTTAGIRGTVTVVVDPSVMTPDDFSDEIELEIWARYYSDSNTVGPRITAYAQDATPLNAPIYTNEYGSNGKTVIVGPTSTSVPLLTRLGSLTIPIDKIGRAVWYVTVGMDCVSLGTGTGFGLDAVVIVPARSRALNKTGVAADSSYPKLFFTGGVKTITPNLQGFNQINAGTPMAMRSTGLGGSQLLLPPGPLTFLYWLSAGIPDDPTATTALPFIPYDSTYKSFMNVRQRYRLVRPT